MKRINRRSLATILLAFLCAVLLFCSVGLFSGDKISKAQSSTATNNVVIPELTLTGYEKRKGAGVFNAESLQALYKALLGNSSTKEKPTIDDVKNSVSGTVSYGGGSAYITGTSNSVMIPAYKNAKDLYDLNGGNNIVVSFGGLDWTVTFLTKDKDGKLVATLWLADGLKNGGSYVRSQFGYNGGTSNNFSVPSNKYSYSALRMQALNAGPTNGSATSWQSSSSATTPITDAARKNHQLAKFTLDSTVCPQSLIDYIDQPSKLKYQYYESFPLQYKDKSGSGNTAILLNEAISKDIYGYAGAGVGSATIPTAANSSSSTATGVWYNANMRNISNQADYNAWADDYVWAPSLTETGRTSYSTIKGQVGLWGTTYSTSASTGQTKFGSGAAAPKTDFNDVNDGHEFSWLRSGVTDYTYTSRYLSSSGSYGSALTVRSLVVRPALHLNLDSAALSAALPDPTDISKTKAYDGTNESDIIYNGGKTTAALGKKQEVKYLNPSWYLDKYYGDSSKVELTYEFIERGDTTGKSFKTPSAGNDGITAALKVNPTSGGDVLMRAGKYKVTVKLLDSKLTWKTDSLDYGTASQNDKDLQRLRVAYFEIKPLKIKYKWANSGLDSSWKASFAENFIPANGAAASTSAAPWVYLSFTLPVAADNADVNTLTYDATNGASNKLVPCVLLKFVGSDSQFSDETISDVLNKRTGKGEKFPQHADNYTVSFDDKNASTSNYELEADTGESATRSYTIERKSIAKPTAPSTQEYSGSDISFTDVPGVDCNIMSYGQLATDGVTFVDGEMPKEADGVTDKMTATVNETSKKLTLKAKATGKYDIYYRLKTQTNSSSKEVVRDYKWTDTADGVEAAVEKVTYEIKPKTLEFTFTSSADKGTWTINNNDEKSKLTFDYASGKGPVNGEEPVLELYYYYNTDGESKAALNPDNATTPKEMLFKHLKGGADGKHLTGKYTVVVKLAAYDDTNNTVNANYTTKVVADDASDADKEAALKTYTQAVEITAGEANINDLPIVYKEGDNIKNADAPTALSFDYTNKKNLQYKLGSDGKTPVEYWIYFDLSGDFSFLETVGAISYQYDAPATDTTACTYDPYAAMQGNTTGSFPMRYAGTLTITVKVKVKDSEKANNKLPAQADYDALTDKVFTYTAGTPDGNGNVYEGTLEFTYEIRKAEVDATKLSDTSLLQWKYSTESDTEWKDYTAKSFPEYNEIATVDFRINPSKYNSNGDGTLAGVKAAALDSITNNAGQPEKQGPGQRFVTIAYTVDENNYEKVNYQNTTLSGKYKYTVKISPKVIDSGKLNLTTWQDANGKDVTNSLGIPYQIWELDLADDSFKNFIKYEYYLYDAAGNTVGNLIGTGEQALKDLTNPSGSYASLNIDAGQAAYIYVKPVIDLAKVDKVNGEPKYALVDVSGNTDKDASGNDGYKKFEFGKQMTVIKVELVKSESVYGEAFTAADILKVTMGGAVSPESTYNTKVYKDKIEDANFISDFAAFCTNSASLDAGKYIIKVTAVNDALFVAVPATVEFEIKPKKIAVPELKDVVFSGNTINLADYLGGSYEQYKDIITLGGDYENIRNVSANGYVATLTLTNTNYEWDYTQGGTTPSKLVLTNSEVKVDGTAQQANYTWNVAPLVVDANNIWNTSGKDGASLNVPDSIKDMIASGSLAINYKYYDDAGNPVENLEKGKSYRVEAVLTGDDAGNVLFKTTSGSTTSAGLTSDKKMYTVPQSGASAFFGKAATFFKANWLWFLIGFLVLLFLIILIVLLCKRRKNKEERLAKKEAKEEERRRKEEEREEEKRRREAERELEKAKAEAELAKMRAGLGLGAGAAGMAMAAQQQPVQQPVQQQMPQQMPMQQPMQQPMMQMPQYIPVPMQMPMQMPQYPQNNFGPQPGYGGGNGDGGAISRLENAFMSMRAEQRTDAKLENELLKLRLDMKDGNAPAPRQPVYEQPTAAPHANTNGNNAQFAEQFGMMMAAMMKSMGVTPKVTEEPKPVLAQSTDDTVITTPTVYPPDAVITTTTTVDTTKPKPEVSRDTNRNFDIDGFYDTFDGKQGV